MEKGAWRFTLDAVARQGGVSKGGLLYHFPSKDELLRGLVARLLERGMDRRRKIREKTGDTPEAVLKADVEACLLHEDRNARLGAALIAVLANEPNLTTPIREFHQDRFKELESLPLDTDEAAILFLAADGLMLLELLNASPFGDARRQQLVDVMLKMAKKLAKAHDCA